MLVAPWLSRLRLVTAEATLSSSFDLRLLESVTPGEMPGFVVHHHIAPDRLAGSDLIGSETEEHSHFGRGDRLGPAPPVAVAEHHLIVQRPLREHGRIDQNHDRIGQQIPKNIGDTKLAILQAPGRSEPEISQRDRENVPHQVEISGPEQKRENRIREP